MNRQHSRSLAGAFRRSVLAAVLVSATLTAAATAHARPSLSATREHHRVHDDIDDDDIRGPADTVVANWDSIGTQAFTAAALTPAEGHTIFAYVAIAIYDSVVAIEGTYEPFAIDADAPADASTEAAVAAAADDPPVPGAAAGGGGLAV